MEYPNDISSCHKLLRDQEFKLTQFRELLGVKDAENEKLCARVDQVEVMNKGLTAQMAQMTLDLLELRSRLNQNSSNSNWSSSRDIYKQKPAFERPKGGKVGGKTGHEGDTLKMVSVPDLTFTHKSDVCSQCGKAHGMEDLRLTTKRQVHDIPAVSALEVTQHQLAEWNCSNCQHQNQGTFPPGVNAPTQYGIRMIAHCSLFNNAYNISRNKVISLIKNLYGATINEQTLQAMNERAYESLALEELYIKERLMQSEVNNCDETGFYVAQKRFWEHVISNPLFTYLFIHPKRGIEAHEPHLSFLHTFKNWMVHDCWGSYFKFKEGKHAICGAHLLRELKALIERGSKWAIEFHALLMTLYKDTQNGTASLPPNKRKKALDAYAKLLKMANAEEPLPIPGKKGKPTKTKGRNLFDRLSKHKDAVLAFAFHDEVPFTNNLAERDIRPTKTKMKVSGCFRTNKGALIYTRFQSFASTVRKHGQNPLTELITVLMGGVPVYRTNPC
jgi:transposase